MIFKNAMSFKAKMSSLGKEKGLLPQYIQQAYLIERFLLKLSKSKYKSNFIVKGGFLIGGMIGIDSRTTMDLDTTFRGYDLTAKALSEIIPEILATPTNDQFVFEFIGVEPIRDDDEYGGFKVKFHATYEKLDVPLSIDVTTGDKITPGEVSFSLKTMFDDEVIDLLSYNLETILAEKLETIIVRGELNTRSRDYYDVYILSKLKTDQIQFDILAKALAETSKKRQSESSIADYLIPIEHIRNSGEQQRLWDKYRRTYSYASGITLEECLNEVVVMMERIIDS
ncbi:abortive infection protein [Clostridia bacterium]|nr:abortive infection protein [Clostridia bacterium]